MEVWNMWMNRIFLEKDLHENIQKILFSNSEIIEQLFKENYDYDAIYAYLEIKIEEELQQYDLNFTTTFIEKTIDQSIHNFIAIVLNITPDESSELYSSQNPPVNRQSNSQSNSQSRPREISSEERTVVHSTQNNHVNRKSKSQGSSRKPKMNDLEPLKKIIKRRIKNYLKLHKVKFWIAAVVLVISAICSVIANNLPTSEIKSEQEEIDTRDKPATKLVTVTEKEEKSNKATQEKTEPVKKEVKEKPKKELKEEPKKEVKEKPKKEVKEEPKKVVKEEPEKEDDKGFLSGLKDIFTKDESKQTADETVEGKEKEKDISEAPKTVQKEEADEAVEKEVVEKDDKTGDNSDGFWKKILNFFKWLFNWLKELFS